MVQLKKENTQINKSTPMVTPWVMQPNNKLVADPNQYQSTKPAEYQSNYKNPTSLGQDVYGYVKNNLQNTALDWKQAWQELKQTWKNMKDFFTPTKEIRPKDAFEETAWGWNYGFDRAVSQADNQQWHYNALQNTWHVVGLPEWQRPTLNQPLTNNTWNKVAERTSRLWELKQPTVAGWTNTQPVNPAPVKWNNTTVQPNVSNQNNTQTEPTVTPDEFWTTNESQTQQWQNSESYNNSVMQNMSADLNQSTAWELYGKVTADRNTSIKTLEDANSVYAAATQSRIDTVKTMLSIDPRDIATAMSSWFNPFDDMAMRDLMQYAPERYKEIQAELKKIQNWETANAIATWTAWPNVTGTAISTTNNWVNTWAEWVSSSPLQTSQIITKISNAMANNQVATTATQEILNIDKQIAEYEEKLNNLEKEANAAFRWDVPQYIVSAYMANRRQQYQSEINKLESRQNTALDLLKFEVSNAQWKEEMNLKYLQYQQWVSNDNWTRYYQSQQLKMNSIKWVDGKAYQMNGDWTITQLSDATALMNYNNDVNSALQGYMSIYTAWWATKTGNGYKYNVSGGQCETFTDNFTEATTWLRMTWEGGRWWTTAEEKLWYINSFVPEVWSVAIGVGWAYDSKYWHTMLVTGYDPSTWIVDLLWSNKDGDEMVYSTTAKLSDLQAKWLKWFWNPYKDMVAQGALSGNYQFDTFNTPMASAFERISTDSSLSATQRNALPIAMEMYDTLYRIANNWQLDALVESWDLALILTDFKNKKFSNADKWENFLDAFTKALNNKAERLAWGDDSYLALMSLQRLIEAKLRDESWAAISSSEWATNFSYLLPQAWESMYVKQWKLWVWDDIISTKFIKAWWKLSEYRPIFQDSTVREIWAN